MAIHFNELKTVKVVLKVVLHITIFCSGGRSDERTQNQCCHSCLSSHILYC